MKLIWKSEKTVPKYMYFLIVDFGKVFRIFVQQIFLTLVQKVLGQKITFWRFFKTTVFSQKADDYNRFLVKFPF